MRELLKGITTDEFRVIAIGGLRRWAQADSARLKQVEWSVHGHFGSALVPALAERVGKPADEEFVHRLKEWFLACQGDQDMQPWTDFIAWFSRVGFALPTYRSGGQANGYPDAMRLTSVGRRFLERTDGDHPYLPGFVDRVVARCPGLPEEVTVLLADAQACAENQLGRPAVVLAGVGYEAAAEAAIERLEQSAKIRPITKVKAAQRIAAMKANIPDLFKGAADPEGRFRAEAAWDFADRLRERRNHASHPKAYPDFSDLDEVHEYLLSAGRHLPGLWSVVP